MPTFQPSKYEIIRRLATGGMAEILLGRVSGLLGFQKLVVIKRILAQYSNEPDFVQMFLDEARIATTLQHPNIVQTYDVGVSNGSYFLVMEFLEGENLVSVLNTLAKKNQRLPLEHALHIVASLAAGLHYAHEKKDFDGRPLDIVHRDVSPHNAIITREGGVKLLDFGIAKSSENHGETRVGTVKGKISFMSPEQCRCEKLDRRSDLFSLGIMLYEMTVGVRPFTGANDFEILKMIVEDDPVPPHLIEENYPAELERIVLKALEKDRARRYQTTQELQSDLESLVRETRLPASPIALGSFMLELFGPVKSSLPPGVSSKVIPLPTAAPGEGTQAARPSSISGASVSIEIVSPPAARRRRMWVIAPALSVAAAGAAIFLGVHLRVGPAVAPAVEAPPAVAPPIAAPSPTPAPASPHEKTVVTAPLLIEPAGAPAPAVAPGPPAARDETTKGKRSTSPVRHVARPAAPAAKPVSAVAASDVPDVPPAAAKPATPPPVEMQGEGNLVLASNPWCNVTIDGVARGPTPLDVKLRAGSHTVVLTNDEFKIRRAIPIVVPPNQVVRKRFDFAPE